MSKVEYVGPRVEISNHGITYRYSKEDKYIYLLAALEILKNIDNDYAKKSSYTNHYQKHTFNEEELHKILKQYENDIEKCVTQECERYQQKIKHEIDNIRNLAFLADIDKEVWIKNIEIMNDYRIQRAINKIYYMHCIKDIVHVIRHKNIKMIKAPFTKDFFHVLNTIKGTLITGKPSLEARVTEEQEGDDMILKLSIR